MADDRGKLKGGERVGDRGRGHGTEGDRECAAIGHPHREERQVLRKILLFTQGFDERIDVGKIDVVTRDGRRALTARLGWRTTWMACKATIAP